MGRFRYVIYLFAIIGVLFVAMTIYSNLGPNCWQTHVVEVASPDGRSSAVHVIEQCVSNEAPKSVVWLDSESMRKAVLRAPGTSTEVELTWLDNSRLRVTYPATMSAVKSGGFNNIDIEYRPKAADTFGQDDLIAWIQTRDVDLIVQGLNQLKGKRSTDSILQKVEALWSLNKSAYPNLPWDTVALPVVRLELGNVLVQAHRNGTPTQYLAEIHDYSREQVSSDSRAAIMAALFVLNMFNDPRDVPAMKAVATQRPDLLRPVMVSLGAMCIPEADEVAASLLESCKGSDCADLKNGHVEMLDLKARAWCNAENRLTAAQNE